MVKRDNLFIVNLISCHKSSNMFEFVVVDLLHGPFTLEPNFPDFGYLVETKNSCLVVLKMLSLCIDKLVLYAQLGSPSLRLVRFFHITQNSNNL